VPIRLVIQIPAYNEAKALPVTLANLPREVPGVDEVEWLLIDDGSTDESVQVALEHGVEHVIRHTRNLGLARAFMTGLGASLARGADLIVNLDADNQYRAADIPALIEPILSGRAEMTIGTRPIASIRHFSILKKALQRLGSWVVRKVSGIAVFDAPSGFRAFNRNAALRMNVFSSYTYTLETLIQAGQVGIAVESVPIRVNPDLRPSRLIKSVCGYVTRSLLTVIRIFITYRPFRTFVFLGSIPIFSGSLIGLRFLLYYLSGHGAGKIQSLILAAVLLLMGFQLWVLAVIADLINVNRKLLEEVQYQARRRATLQTNLGSTTNPRAPASPPPTPPPTSSSYP